MNSKKIAIFFSSLLFTITAFAQNHYTFDKSHSFLEWEVSHFGYSEVTGKIFFDGTINYNPKQPQKSTFTINVDINSITTGIPKLDKELVGRNYFDAKEFPTATFIANKIIKTSKNTGIIHGKVTIKGITKPLTIKVTLTKSGTHPYYQRPALGFKATTSLKRSDFGIRAYLPGVGDQVTIILYAEAIANKPKSD